MAKDPAFPFYAQDFMTGVMHLTMEERGVYITLIAYQWAHLKIPKKRLGLIVGFDWNSFSDELREKFVESGDFLLNERLEFEREKRKIFKEKQSDNGKKGGRPRKNKNPNETQTKPKQKPLENENEKENEYDNENEKGGVGEKTEIYPSFDDFWEDYDKKIGSKKKLERKWSNLSYQIKCEIMDYIPFYKQSQPNKKYRKNPETFLNNEGWKDELIIETHETNNAISRAQAVDQAVDDLLG
jgi:uncharacterized protein YdaU (DUF1376 family)